MEAKHGTREQGDVYKHTKQMHTYILITHTPCSTRDGVQVARTCRVGKYICVIFTKEQADGWMVTTFGDTGSDKGEAMGHISLFVTSASGMLGYACLPVPFLEIGDWNRN